MKVFIILLLLIPFGVRAAEPVDPPTARGVQSASKDAEEEVFEDPFAAENGTGKVSDPLERMNRAFFRFNDKLYDWVLKPAAKGYRAVAPEPFRLSIKRFFVNARFPVRFVNNLLQGKMTEAAVETARFVVNSTVGIGGLFDPARDEWKLQPHLEDFDQTLGFYKFPTGIYLNWPVFGPSSVRGTVGTVGDSLLSPWHYVDAGAAVIFGGPALDAVNSSSLQLGEYERFRAMTFDPYVALRDAYFQNRLRALDHQRDAQKPDGNE